jgi:hypothetical protein
VQHTYVILPLPTVRSAIAARLSIALILKTVTLMRIVLSMAANVLWYVVMEMGSQPLQSASFRRRCVLLRRLQSDLFTQGAGAVEKMDAGLIVGGNGNVISGNMSSGSN